MTKQQIEAAAEFRRQIAQNIRNRRLALGLSQVALAKLIGVTQARVSFVEKAERGVGVEDLLALAEALETTPADLVTPGVFDPIHA